MSRIGLVAGGGKLPVIFAENAARAGDEVVVFGLKGITSPELEGKASKMHLLDWGEYAKAVLLLTTSGVKKIAMLGKIDKNMILKGDAALDEKSRKVFDKAGGDKKDYSLLKGFAGALGAIGVEVIDPTPYLKELVARKGPISKRLPSQEEAKDIDYGIPAARELARLDIGQAVAVKGRTVVAAEATEGTDEMIRRAGKLSGGSFTVVKVARPGQDMRFDIPIIGLETVKTLASSGGTALAIESGRMLVMDAAEIAALAAEKNLAITAL